MTVIGTLTAALQLDTSGYRKNLAAAQQQTGKAGQQASKAGAGFGALDQNVKKSSRGFRGLTESAGKANPALGSTIGKITSMITPVGLATAAIGGMAAVMLGSVTSALSLGRELGALREKTGISAESLQVFRRAIEEGNGSADAFANTSIYLQRVIGDSADGNKEAADSLAAIGLTYEDLIGLAPEEAFTRVLGATNELGTQSEQTAAKAGLLGRGFAELGGFANLTEAETTGAD